MDCELSCRRQHYSANKHIHIHGFFKDVTFLNRKYLVDPWMRKILQLKYKMCTSTWTVQY